jgi:hypothetical protein
LNKYPSKPLLTYAMLRIPSATLYLPQLPPASKQPLQHTIKLGQILQASVLSENLNGEIKLQIGSSRLLAKTQLSVTPGQQLTLQVEKMGPLPELKLLSLAAKQDLPGLAMKSVLPKQRPLSDLFENLQRVNRSLPSTQTTAEIKQNVQGLITRILAVEHPEFRQALKSALLNSGLFLERHLLDQRRPSNDLKQQLLKLFTLIKTAIALQDSSKYKQARPNLPQQESLTTPVEATTKQLQALLKNIEGSLARIQTNQLASLPPDDPARQAWQFELPLRFEEQVELFQIKIDKDAGSAPDDSATVWNLTLHMNLQSLGPMRVQLKLQGMSIATVIWAEAASTSRLIESRLATLQQAFEQAGLAVTRLQALQAKLHQPNLLPRDTHLVSEKV